MTVKKYKKQGADSRLKIGIILIALWVLVFSLAVFFLFFSGKSSEEDEADTGAVSQEEGRTEDVQGEGGEKQEAQEEKEDPQSESNQTEEETGAESEITKLLLSELTLP